MKDASPKPASVVIFVLLDAFRYDYLPRTRFLADTARRSLVGSLEEPFGFCPRSAYFAGLKPNQQGFANMFNYDPPNSVFGWTRELAGSFSDDWMLSKSYEAILERARSRLPSFGGAHVSPLSIPLERLGCFDLSERYAPWDREEDLGYRSLFHLLDEDERPWMQVSWPFSGLGSRSNNAGVMSEALRLLEKKHEFSFVHLPDLDRLGHQFGPGSVEVQRSIEETDRLCEMLYCRALELHEDPVLLFAGDHGMLPVARNVDVHSVLEGLGFRYGYDFAYFVDSTMVRCWFFSEVARREVRRALSATLSGVWVGSEAAKAWGIDSLPERCGEAFFLAHPGVQFFPNDFAGEGAKPPVGMHGYAPEIRDNQALFMACSRGRAGKGDAGVVNARRIFPSLLQWLGYDSLHYTEELAVVEGNNERASARWTVSGSAQLEGLVGQHMDRAVEAIRTRVPSASAVVLAGGFGRGEGSWMAEQGHQRPLNDYDFLVMDGASGSLGGLGDELAESFGIDFVDLGLRASVEMGMPLEQGEFDLRYGSRVLWGDVRSLDRLPLFAPAQIEANQGFYLLGNRFAGIALALTANKGETWARPEFLRYQIVKFLMAIADVWLMSLADYSASYQVKRMRFLDLSLSTQWDDVVVKAVGSAFDMKIEGQEFGYDESEGLAMVERAFSELARQLDWPAPRRSLMSGLQEFFEHRNHSIDDWAKRLSDHGLSLTPKGREAPAGSLVVVYAACLDIVMRAVSQSGNVNGGDCSEALEPYWEVKQNFLGQRSIARAWLAQFH